MHLKTFSIKSFLIIFLLAVLTTLPFTSFSFAREPIRTITGAVTKVSDGDTVRVTTPEKTKLRIRLYGVDAPETPNLTAKIFRDTVTLIETRSCFRNVRHYGYWIMVPAFPSPSHSGCTGSSTTHPLAQ